MKLQYTTSAVVICGEFSTALPEHSLALSTALGRDTHLSSLCGWCGRTNVQLQHVEGEEGEGRRYYCRTPCLGLAEPALTADAKASPPLVLDGSSGKGKGGRNALLLSIKRDLAAWDAYVLLNLLMLLT